MGWQIRKVSTSASRYPHLLTLFSLMASIHLKRPDLLPDFDKKGSPPISIEIPDDFFVKNEVPDVGELTLASLPENHTFDPVNWYTSLPYLFLPTATTVLNDIRWISEKYDGLRACFHPVQKILYPFNSYVPLPIPTHCSSSFFFEHIHIYSRFGRKFDVPASFLSQFPSSFVDGEIWYG